MDLYFENLSLGVLVFYGLLSMGLGGLIMWLGKPLVRLISKKEPQLKWGFTIISTAIFITFMVLILFDPPYNGGR